jgi:hypothetical protein
VSIVWFCKLLIVIRLLYCLTTTFCTLYIWVSRTEVYGNTWSDMRPEEHDGCKLLIVCLCVWWLGRNMLFIPDLLTEVYGNIWSEVSACTSSDMQLGCWGHV